MTFTITAWGPDGRGVFQVQGPVGKTKIVDDETQATWRTVRRRWAAEEDEYLAKNYYRLPYRELALNLSRTVAAIQRRAHKMGITRRPCPSSPAAEQPGGLNRPPASPEVA